MALNAWQKITRVLPSMPHGDGADGDYSSATVPTMLNDSFTGTSGNNTITTGSATYANGDILRLAQMRGTNAGQWEIVKVLSGGGTTTLTLTTNLQYTYTDSGASQAQATKIPRYRNVTVLSGTWSVPSWNGNLGGVLVFACRGILTVTGSINGNGGNGQTTTGLGDVNGTGGTGGFAGGAGKVSAGNEWAYQGESSVGLGTNTGVSANGSGGGGAHTGGSGGEGGGAGHAVAGSTGEAVGTDPGTGGSTVGDTSLATIFMGAGGGGGANDLNENDGGAGGGAGGKIVIIYAKIIVAPNSISVNGGSGGVGSERAGGGGGAGGSILICGSIIDLGTDKLSAIGGSGGYGSYNGSGDGGKGRIAVYYGLQLIGSVDSSLASFYSELDTTLVEPGGAAIMPDNNR